MTKLQCFGLGVGVGFVSLAVILIVGGKKVEQISVPLVGTITFFPEEEAPKEPPPPPRLQMEIKGTVKDIFDNPVEDVMIIMQETETYSKTDQRGRYHFSNVPEQDYVTLNARYGEQRCSMRIEIARDTKIIEKIVTDNTERKTVEIGEPLILENPRIRVEAYLCQKVVDHEPINRFEHENPIIPRDIGTVWCFVRVFGPLGYEKDKKTEITYLWYWDEELLHRYTQAVGFNPTRKGWRAHAFKNIGGRTGRWRLEIRAKHKRLASILFETY